MKDQDVDGENNIAAGRDVNITNTQVEARHSNSNASALFKAADDQFRAKIIESGIIRRGEKEIEYSSESLFSSLMQLGIPFDASINIPFQIIPVLSDIYDTANGTCLSTSDIRVAVVECIGALVFEDHSEEEVSMWSAAYIRRYGSPDKSSIKVNDNGEEIEFKYPYVKKIIIPHLFKRIFSIQGVNDPIQQFPDTFSSDHLDKMATEIVRFSNTLNLYCIRYKTLINLLEDLIIEPPHPWIVNKDTKKAVTNYNLERSAHHLHQLNSAFQSNNDALFNQASKECFMHLGAAVLSNYGCFLGVGSKYGLLELRRTLKLRLNHKTLWDYCTLNSIIDDLESIGCTTDSIISRSNRILHHQYQRDKPSKFSALYKEANDFAEVVIALTSEHVEANKLLQQTLVPRAAEQ